MIYFAIFYLVAAFLDSLFENMYQVYLSCTHNMNSYVYMVALLFLRLASWLPFVSVVYALVLRKVLSNNLKESGNEE